MSKKKETTVAQIDSLLNKLQPGFRTKKKEAITDFGIFFFEKRYDEPTTKDIFRLFIGEQKRIGLLAICGNSSKRTGDLQKASSLALELVANTMDPNKNQKDWLLFRQVFLGLDKGYYKLMNLETHAESDYVKTVLAIQRLIKDPKKALALESDRDSGSVSEARGSDQSSAGSQSAAKPKNLRTAASNMNLVTVGGDDKMSVMECLSPRSQAVIKVEDDAMAVDAQLKTRKKKNIKAMLSGFLNARQDRESLVKKGVLKKGATFGMNLETLAASGKDGVPDIIRILVDYIRPEICKLTGVFRISGDSLEIQMLKRVFDFESTDGLDLTQYGAHTVTGALKLFLRELPDPLFTFGRYDVLVDAFRSDDFAKCDESIQNLPTPNLNTWNYLLDFLARCATFSTTNMMTAKNLAIVIAPNVLRLEVETFQRIAKDTPVTVGLLEYFIAERVKKLPKAAEEDGGAGDPLFTQQRLGRTASMSRPESRPTALREAFNEHPNSSRSSLNLENIGEDEVSEMTKPSHTPRVNSRGHTPRAHSSVIVQSSKGFQDMLNTPSTPTAKRPACPWTKYLDPNTNAPYFHNKSTGDTVWVQPAGYYE